MGGDGQIAFGVEIFSVGISEDSNPQLGFFTQ